MNRKVTAGVCISLIAIACAVTFVVTWTVSFNMYNERFEGAIQRDEISSKLQEIDSFVRNNYVGSVDNEKVASGIYNGYISGIDDKNTVYMTAEEYNKAVVEESGKLITVGIIPEKEESGYIKIAGVYSGSSAEAVGILKNDVIISIEGVNVLETDADAAIRMLDGEENTRITVTVRHDGEDAEYSLMRQSIDITSVEHTVVGGIGFIRFTAFNELTHGQFEKALSDCLDGEQRDGEEADETKALIIDLRQNKSDYYSPLKDILSGLIGTHTVAVAEYKNDIAREFIVTAGEKAVAVPIIILADGETAGVGELMAHTLRETAGALLVGSNTAGDTTLRSTQKLKDGSAVCVTVAKIIPSLGEEYGAEGLIPDYSVTLSSEVDYDMESLYYNFADIADPQIKKAFEIIETVTQ